jgi:CRP-like cAMP-binding protein
VAFTIGDDVADPRRARGVQGAGECALVFAGEQIAHVARRFGEAFPQLSPGNTLSISFFRITPSSLEFIDNTRAGVGASAGSFGAEFHKRRAYSVFDDLPRDEVESFVAALSVTRLAAGDVLVRQGGPADGFFLVAEGEVELRQGDDGELERLGPGALFGEMAVLRDRPRRTTVRATSPALVWALDRETFRELMARAIGTTPGFAEIVRERLGLAAPL